MAEKNAKISIGGNSIILHWGRFFKYFGEKWTERGARIEKKGSELVVTNPKCRFVNHCTMIFNFTVDSNEKYQIVLQGKFTDNYKSWKREEDDNKNKLEEYETKLSEWESMGIDERGSAPIKPDFRESPLSNQEMFETITHMKRSWYRKDLI